MNPIFNEYIKFLRDTSGEELLYLKEGFFWLDKQIIKGFDSQLVEHKFYRVKVSDNLEKVEILKLKSYEDLIKRGSQIAVLYKKSDDKAIVKEIKSYDQWLNDRHIQLKGA